MSTATIPPAVPEVAPLSEPARIVNTFIAPTKTFTDLRRSAAWWAPFLLIAIVSVLFVFVADRQVGFRKITDNQNAASPRAERQLEQLPPDQREARIETQVKWTRNISYGFFIFILIWNLIVALVIWATLKVFGADLGYNKTLAVVMYSGLVGILKPILAIISIFAGISTDSFTFQNPVATNPGYFLNRADVGGFIYSFATSLDVFMIWTLVLAGIGISVVSNVKRSTAMSVIFGWWAVLVLGGAGLAAVFG